MVVMAISGEETTQDQSLGRPKSLLNKFEES